MIFHITSQHDYESCEGTQEQRGEDVPPRSERQRWVEGNDKVKVERTAIKRNTDITPSWKPMITQMCKLYLVQLGIYEQVKLKSCPLTIR